MAALLLGFCAHLRAPEYDEAYSMFLTAGDARPAWPAAVFTSSEVRHFYTGRAGFGQITDDLKKLDVHPPLYFWALELWRRVFGPGWFMARLFSVALSVATLGLLAGIAAGADAPILPTLAITLLSYGFAYTGILARGFALAQFLNVLGTLLVLAAARKNARRHALAGGLALGAASFTNYLAVFIGLGLLVWLALKKRALCAWAGAGFAVFVALDLPFYLAQKNSRVAQFAAFSWRHTLLLLAKDSGAAMFGGLPLYAGRFGGLAAGVLLVLFLACLAVAARRGRLLFAALALALPAGLVALGLVFHNTPVEIRYLAFSIPFLALFLAQLPRALLLPLLACQAGAVLGLAFSPATMQPQALAAAQEFPKGALVLLPYGNDGVGVPGPFIATAPPDMRILLLRPGMAPDLSSEHTLVLITLRVDDASRAATAAMLRRLHADPCRAASASTPYGQVFIELSTAFCEQKAAKNF